MLQDFIRSVRHLLGEVHRLHPGIQHPYFHAAVQRVQISLQAMENMGAATQAVQPSGTGIKET